MKRREIGGYFEFEQFDGQELHNKAIRLNWGRSCLRLLIRVKEIKKLYIPYYICPSIECSCKEEAVKIEKYHITDRFLPDREFALGEKEYVLIVNYFGLLTNDELKQFVEKNRNVIIDNTQAFFQDAIENSSSFYSCRKFFGVSDGAYLYTDESIKENFSKDVSYRRMQCRIGRMELEANLFYDEYCKVEEESIRDEIKEMSAFTQNIMRVIDYSAIKEKRRINYNVQKNFWDKGNLLKIEERYSLFTYPLLMENGSKIRKKLFEKKIYTPTYWNGLSGLSDFEEEMARNCIFIPIDHRYTYDEMNYICSTIDGLR